MIKAQGKPKGSSTTGSAGILRGNPIQNPSSTAFSGMEQTRNSQCHQLTKLHMDFLQWKEANPSLPTIGHTFKGVCIFCQMTYVIISYFICITESFQEHRAEVMYNYSHDHTIQFLFLLLCTLQILVGFCFKQDARYCFVLMNPHMGWLITIISLYNRHQSGLS